MLKLMVALIWEMQKYFDTNDCFLMISFEFKSLSHNFYSAAFSFLGSNCNSVIWSPIEMKVHTDTKTFNNYTVKFGKLSSPKIKK